MSVPSLIIRQLENPDNRRIVVISDIHGELDLFKRLLDKVGFCDDDILVILGDFYLKGSQQEETFHYVMELDKQPNVHVLRGNCEWWREDFYTDQMWDWVCKLPIILEGEDMVFVHAALEDKPLDEQDVLKCLTTFAFMEIYKGAAFDRWVVVGHCPTVNYCYKTPCYAPIFDNEKKIISIDGGIVVKSSGQLNALIINSRHDFDWMFVDNFPVVTIKHHQQHMGTDGPTNITFLDRLIEIVEHGEEFSKVRHKSGKIIEVPTDKIWQDDEGRDCIGDFATDAYLPVMEGDELSVIATYSNKIFAKNKSGYAGWVNL